MRGIALYTTLRVAVLLAAWLAIQVVTPLRGLIAIAVALVISGVISFFVLDRPRNQASRGLSGIFRRIDERIERSRTAEDIDDDRAPAGSGQTDAKTEQEPVGEDDDSGRLQDGDEGATRRPA
ncbi:MAG: DUF4229 domain-containing protein [Actinobacteria bacterium]|nr:DUF4229 domain-containing protein [Actinomycetota bacterium]